MESVSIRVSNSLTSFINSKISKILLPLGFGGPILPVMLAYLLGATELSGLHILGLAFITVTLLGASLNSFIGNKVVSEIWDASST